VLSRAVLCVTVLDGLCNRLQMASRQRILRLISMALSSPRRESMHVASHCHALCACVLWSSSVACSTTYNHIAVTVTVTVA
jgi:hypothetical protein